MNVVDKNRQKQTNRQIDRNVITKKSANYRNRGDSLQLHDKKEAANFERLLFLHNLLASIDLEELVHHELVIAVQDDVVVAQWILQEIVGGSVHADADLCATHIYIVGILGQGARGEVVLVQAFAATLHERDIACWGKTLYADAFLRLEVAAQDEALCLLQADGAVREDHFIRAGVYQGRVGHERRFAGQYLCGQHGEDGLEVAFTSRDDALVVE